VVIPALNEEKELGECLASLAGQAFPEFEVIVVDNGSTDKTSSLAEEWGARVVFEGRRGPVMPGRLASARPGPPLSPPPMQIRFCPHTGFSGFIKRFKRIRKP
jgi:Glycosyltransferases involved in cell wall biogenesis